MSSVPEKADLNRPYHEGVPATTREVYPTDEDTVIKIPQKPHFVEENEMEVLHWESFGDEKIMAPIIDWADDYEWIEMVECYRVTDKSLVERYRDKLSEFNAPIIDTHVDNLGILPSTGEVVCIDYAMCEEDLV